MRFSKILMVAMVVVVFVLVANLSTAHASRKNRKWHQGPYAALNAGLIHMCDDSHSVTRVKFGGCADLTFGSTFGWDIADWIGPMLQLNYSTSTAWVGNGGVATGDYPAGTFPTENARQHAINVSLFARATLPYFTHARWQPEQFKIHPYAKLGATMYIMYLHAPSISNSLIMLGGGPAVGVGVEVFVWEGFYVALDITENLIFQRPFFNTIAGIRTQVAGGSFKPQTAFMLLFGHHF